MFLHSQMYIKVTIQIVTSRRTCTCMYTYKLQRTCLLHTIQYKHIFDVSLSSLLLRFSEIFVIIIRAAHIISISAFKAIFWDFKCFECVRRKDQHQLHYILTLFLSTVILCVYRESLGVIFLHALLQLIRVFSNNSLSQSIKKSIFFCCSFDLIIHCHKCFINSSKTIFVVKKRKTTFDFCT